MSINRNLISDYLEQKETMNGNLWIVYIDDYEQTIVTEHSAGLDEVLRRVEGIIPPLNGWELPPDGKQPTPASRIHGIRRSQCVTVLIPWTEVTP